jgi:alpha-tubulin suppressor-like RCC1 family protein
MVQTDQRFASIAAGGSHVCALTGGGNAWCWGRNDAGQLGAATGICTGENGFATPCSWKPVPVSGDRAFVQIVAAAESNCALDAAGRAWCWGLGSWGQLGDGGNVNSATPVAVAGGHVFTRLAAGDRLVCGLDGSRALWCWGTAWLWPATAVPVFASPVPARWTDAAAVPFVSIALSPNHACGLDAAGKAWCWGWGRFGALGSDGGQDSLEPRPVLGDHVLRAISVGAAHSCALAVDDSAWCWGGGGGVGNSNPPPASPLPVLPVVGGLRFAKIASGVGNSCAVGTDGQGWCWGDNQNRVRGLAEHGGTVGPSPVLGDYRFIDVALGNQAACGISQDGAAVCWGYNEFGAVGRPIVYHSEPG